MIRALKLYQSLKKIDSIWVILKKSKSWEKKRRKYFTTGKRYIHHYHKYVSKFFAAINEFG